MLKRLGRTGKANKGDYTWIEGLLSDRADAVQDATRSNVARALKIAKRERATLERLWKESRNMANDIDVTDAEIDEAIERGKSAPKPRGVKCARYDAVADMVELDFPEGTKLRIPRRLLQGLTDASSHDLAEIDFSGLGTALWWPRLEVGHAVSDLEAGWYGSPSWCESVGLRPRAAT